MTVYDYGAVSFRAKIKVLPTDSPRYNQFGGKLFETTVGRLMFNVALPKDYPYINDVMGKKQISSLITNIIEKYGVAETPHVLDKIKSFGFKYSTMSGATWGIDNVIVPKEKPALVLEGRKKEKDIIDQYNEGLLSYDEKWRKTIEIWEKVKNDIQDLLPASLEPNGSTEDMIVSGARGSIGQLIQMAGMKGLIVNTQGKTLDFPIIPSYKEGLSPLEYFITTHGSRKGLADTALKTAQAGYLTRRLVDVVQDVVVTAEDCGTKKGKIVSAENISGIEIPLAKNVVGRTLASPVVDSKGTVLFKRDHLVSREDAKAIQESGVENVHIRSLLTCETGHGVCQKCYGLDLGRGAEVKLGEAVGIVAAQAIGEPGTQLTLRTFHAGGVAGGADITQGLPRVEEVFERRNPKIPAVVAQANGQVTDIIIDGLHKTIKVLGDSKGDKGKNELEYVVPNRRSIVVKVGDNFEAGSLLTDGSAKIVEVFKFGGKEKAEDYIIQEINKVYEVQGAPVSRKHLEIIVRQMFSRRRIKDAGDTQFSAGDVVEYVEFLEENAKAEEKGGEPAKAEVMIEGITQVSLTTSSWLSAASFQNTNRVLIANAIKGGVDKLRGLKENVIIGRLVPAGTGFRDKGQEVIEDEAVDSDQDYL
jgi:DNA-directed RNA polymerase subunit beta'